MGGPAAAAGDDRDHPFSGYNKKDIHTALVGNWVEERALKADTGIFRYQGWVSDEAGPTVYAEQVGRPENVETFDRVVLHSNRLESAEWKTASQTVFQAPARRVGEQRTYIDVSKVGTRTAAMLRQLAVEAAVVPSKDTIPATTESTSRSTYKAHDLTGMKIGARVMQSQDGVPIPAAACDFTFRAESGMCPKASIDALRVPPVDGMQRLHDTAGGSMYNDAPQTIYAQQVRDGAYPNDNFFGSKPAGLNPFAKNTNYSKPITDYSKDPSYVE